MAGISFVGKQSMRSPSLSVSLIRYVSALHLAWAGLLLFSTTAGHATTTASLIAYLPIGRVGVALFLAAASIAALATLFRMDGPSLWTAVALTPQGLLLTMAALGACNAIWFSHFADGVERSRWFIAADQQWALWLWAFHVYAVLGLHMRQIRWRT
jgi:hypothetical protein